MKQDRPVPMSRRGLAIALLVLASTLAAPLAGAQTPVTPNAVTTSSPATDKPPPLPPVLPQPGAVATNSVAAPDCTAALPKVPPPGDQKLTVALTNGSPGSRGAIWQPRGGEVSFTVTSADGKALDPMNIVTCFRWHSVKDNDRWEASPLPLRIINAGQGTITYGARVPDLPDASPGWLKRVTGGAGEEEYAGLWVVPIADFRVVATAATDWKSLDVVLPVGVTSVIFSSLAALLGVAGAWWLLYRFGAVRGVPGNDPVLKLISTRLGYSSLSQLQILLWSFVVGASAIYVMALSGDLIDISDGTLLLLGISGVSVVGSKLQSHLGDNASGAPAPAVPTTPAAPGPVIGLGLAPGFGPTDGEVRLAWPAPGGGGPPDSYTIQYRLSEPPAGPWMTASSTVTKPVFAVVGLAETTKYDFQIAAVNAGGSGTFSPPLAVTTTAAIPIVKTVPVQVANLSVGAVATDGSALALSWDPVLGATGYRVQFRLHDSDETWRSAGIQMTVNRSTIPNLPPNSLHDVRVAAMKMSDQGAWSAIVSGATGPRIPLWSDLIIAPAGGNTVDMARVQMLFFTVIGAIFVGLKVYTGSQIPDIPQGFLLLMGISNGVYLTAKFIPG